jgi:hypothetical protein
MKLRNVIAVSLLALVAGCATTKIVPVMVMPDAPANLLVPTQDLTTIPPVKKPVVTENKNASG